MKNKNGHSLEGLLANLYLLLVKTQNFHWNVKGSNFYSLHLLFEKQYDELALEVDAVAELISSLGNFVPSSLGKYSEAASIEDAPSKQIEADKMLHILADDHGTVIEQAEMLLKKFDGRDFVTNALSNIIEGHNKMRWMLTASQK